MIKRLIVMLVAAVFMLVAVVALISWWTSAPEADNVRIDNARVAEVKSMIRLSSLDIYEEIPVKAHIGSRHLVARQRLEGSVSFDLDSLRMEQKGDTIVITLPREVVNVYESTKPGSYQVLDNWNDRFLASGNFTAAEENRIKKQAVDAYVKSLYTKGYIRDARTTARRNVSRLLRATTGKTIVVVDSMPCGCYFRPQGVLL